MGTTQNISGTGVYNEESGEFQIEINVDLSNLSTGSSGRDNDVVQFFTPNTAKIEISSLDNTDVVFGEPTKVEAKVTINDKTLTLNLDSTINIIDQKLTASGETKFNMSEFGVTPPSTAGVYTVDDETVVRFNVTAEQE